MIKIKKNKELIKTDWFCLFLILFITLNEPFNNKNNTIRNPYYNSIKNN